MKPPIDPLLGLERDEGETTVDGRWAVEAMGEEGKDVWREAGERRLKEGEGVAERELIEIICQSS